MATCREVIEDALRKTGVRHDLDGATVWQLDRGMRALQDLLDGFAASGLLGRMAEGLHPYTGTLGAENMRLRIDGIDGVSVTMSGTVDGCNGPRAPRNHTMLTIIDAVLQETAVVIYDAQRGTYVQFSDLTLDTYCPLSNRGDGLASCLAEQLADEPGAVLNPVTVRSAAKFRTALAMGFDGPRQTVTTEFF